MYVSSTCLKGSPKEKTFRKYMFPAHTFWMIWVEDIFKIYLYHVFPVYDYVLVVMHEYVDAC